MKNTIKLLVLLCFVAFGFIPTCISSAETIKTYKIKFNSNDGFGTITSINKMNNVAFTLPDCTVSHEGFDFLGWSADKYRMAPDYYAGDSFDINENTILYAIWHLKGETGHEATYSKPLRSLNVNGAYTTKVKKSTTIKASATGEGKAVIKYKSLNKKIAKVSSSGKVTGIKKGKAKILVTVEEDGLYGSTSKTISVTVKKLQSKRR